MLSVNETRTKEKGWAEGKLCPVTASQLEIGGNAKSSLEMSLSWQGKGPLEEASTFFALKNTC
jgi:hypothetical protein